MKSKDNLKLKSSKDVVTNTDVLKEIFDEINIKKNEAASLIKVTAPTLTKYISGEIKLKLDKLILMSEKIEEINPHLVYGNYIDEIIPNTPFKLYHRYSQLNQFVLMTHLDVIETFPSVWYEAIKAFNKTDHTAREMYLKGIKKSGPRLGGCDGNDAALKSFTDKYVSVVDVLIFRKDIQWTKELGSSDDESDVYVEYGSIKESVKRFDDFKDVAKNHSDKYMMSLLEAMELLDFHTLDFIYCLALSQFDEALSSSILNDWLVN